MELSEISHRIEQINLSEVNVSDFVNIHNYHSIIRNILIINSKG